MILYWCIQQRPINPNNWFDRFIDAIINKREEE